MGPSSILQPSLFDRNEYFKPPLRIGNEPEEKSFDEWREERAASSLADYGGDSGAWTMGGEWGANPLPRPQANVPWLDRPKTAEEWVPTTHVTSAQPKVNPAAIEHQVQHADPLRLADDPVMTAYQERSGEEHYYVRDGNHRVNAAMRRGMLFMPAVVQRGGEY